MVYGIGKQVSGYLAGSELVRGDNGGGIDVAFQSGQIANAPGPAGSGVATFGRSGNIGTSISAAGVSPAATGSDYVIAFVAIPAGSFDVANRALEVQASGSFAANGNTKRVRIQTTATLPVVGAVISGGTVVADSAAVTTNAGGWSLTSEIAKYGAAGSNTQIAIHTAVDGMATTALVAPALLTLAENAPIYVAVTANCTTSAADVLFNFLQSFWQN